VGDAVKRCALVLMLAAPALSGCVMHLHASTNIVAQDAAVPVSLSETVRDADGNLVLPDRQQVVGVYDETFHAYNIPWGIIPLHPTTDISDSVNEAVAAVHGDAITELTVVADQCWTRGLAFFWFLPIVPSCAAYEVRGRIIRVGQAAPPASATVER
jgi:hypothetical protein